MHVEQKVKYINREGLIKGHQDQSGEPKAVELTTIIPVTRLLWKTLRYQSTVTLVQEDPQIKSAEQNPLQNTQKVEPRNEKAIQEHPEQSKNAIVVCIDEISQEEGDAVSKEEALEEMRRALAGSKVTRSAKLLEMVRESQEFGEQDLGDEDEEDYEEIKSKVLEILRREIDKRDYRQTMKVCKKVSRTVEGDWVVGSSYRGLQITLKLLELDQE